MLNECLQEHMQNTFDEIDNKDLPDILYDFYTDLRKTDGEHYKLQSLKCVCAGINQYTKEHRNLDIIKDIGFTRSNEMFSAVSKKYKKNKKKGLATTKSYPPIEPEDLGRLAQYLDHDMMNHPNPRKLQKSVLFNIIFFFCRRGRQNTVGPG